MKRGMALFQQMHVSKTSLLSSILCGTVLYEEFEVDRMVCKRVHVFTMMIYTAVV